MNRTRRSILVIALAVLTGGTALFAAGRHLGWRWTGAPSRAASLPDLAALAPANSNLVVFADVSALRASPLLEQLRGMLPSPTPDPDYAAFVRASGFDYERDLDRVLLASHQTGGKTELVAIADGRFDRAKIRSYALANGKLEKHDGVDVYLLPSGAPGSPQAKTIALAFLSDTRVAISDSGNLDSFLAESDRARTTQALATGELSLDERVSHVGEAPLFVVTRVPDEPANWAPGGVHSDQLNDLARSIRWIDIKVQPMADHLHVTLEGECVDQEKATSLQGTLTGLRFLAEAYLGTPSAQKQMDPQNLARARQLLDSAAITHNDRWVALSVDLTQDLLKTGLQPTHHAPPLPR
ncbi:MAG: hypothetical protein WA871_13040 [Candidatus Acidiferrales bacterium]